MNLREFCHKLRGLNLEWHIRQRVEKKYDTLRTDYLEHPPYGYCPITALLGESAALRDAKQRGIEVLGLSPLLAATIVNAADDYYPPLRSWNGGASPASTRRVRRALMKYTGGSA